MDAEKPQTIEAYIVQYDPDMQTRLQALRQTILAAAPGAQETIAYGIPTFKVNGKNLVHFGAYKKHIGFYPNPGGIEAFAERLAPYEQSKGTVKFPLDQPLPLDLIAEIVAYRVQQVQGEA